MFFNYIKNAFIRKNIVLYVFCFAILLGQDSSNYSLNFDGGSNYVDFGEGNGDFDSYQYTVSTWVKLNDTKSYGGIIGKGTGGGEVNYSFLLWFPETSWGVESVSQKVFFSLNGVSGGSIDSRHIFDNAFEMPVNEWHYISVTVNDSTKYAKLYIDGELFSERNFSGQNISINDNPLQLGTYNSGSYTLNGKISSLALWNQELSIEQIQDNMTSSIIVSEQDIIGHWDFTDGEATSLADLSGNGNNGTIYGATWRDDIPPTLGGNNAYTGGTITYGSNPLGDSVGDFSYSFWVKLNKDPGQNEKLFGQNNDMLDFAWQSDRSIHFMNFFSGYQNFDTEDVNYFVPLHEWTQIVFTRDVGVSRSIYINGSLLMSAEDGGGNVELPAPFVNCESFSFDEFQIWDYARNENEIASDVNILFDGSENGLVGYWRFDEGNGIFTSDISSGEMEGHLSNLGWVGNGAPVELFTQNEDDFTSYLFFSEWAEGSSNNRYLELYNGSDEYVNLSEFSLSSCSNGCDNEYQFDYPDNVIFDSSIVLAPEDVFVVCHPNASDSILMKCDQTFNYMSNGDDFFALTESGATSDNYVIHDKIGDFGPDPGSGWPIAGILDATRDNTLIRKSFINTGNTDWLSSSGTDTTNSEWIIMERPTTDYTPQTLGSHNVQGEGYTALPISVTFLVNMRDYEGLELETGEIYDGDLSEGIFLAGGNIGWMADSTDEQIGFQMSDDDGDLIYEVTIELEQNSFYFYKFRIGLTDGNWFGKWESISDCGYGDWNDRYVNTSFEESQVVGPYCFSSCENCEVPNMSLSFDGVDDYIFVENPGPSGDAARSIQFKVKLNSYEDYQGLLYYGNHEYGDWGQLFSINFDNSGLVIDHNSGWCKFDGIILDSSFHDYTLVMEEGNTLNELVLYQDGVRYDVSASDHGSPGTFVINTAYAPLYIGKSRYISDDYPSQYFNGLIDELVFWDIPLSIEQVEDFLIDPPSYNEQGIVSYWDFNEGDGDTINDLSGHNNNGVIFGATWSEQIMQPPYSGPDWFVSNDGSDDNNGSQDYPFSSIQHAINASNGSDSIFVASGTYFENLFIGDKNISLISLDGAESTFLDGGGNGRVIDLSSSNSDSSHGVTIIDGFTIRNGIWDASGAGINIYYGHMEINNSTIEGNESTSDVGGGIAVEYGSLYMHNCSIRGNKARSGGGIAVISFSEVNVNESSLNNNDAIQQGGGVFISDSSSAHFEGCNISYNVTYQDCFTGQGSQGAGIFVSGSFLNFSYGLIYNNKSADTGGGIFASEGSYADFNHGVIFGNQAAEVGGGINTAGAGIGAAFDSNINFTHCSLADNITLSGGVGGFFGASSTIDINSCIFWNNHGEWQGSNGQLLGSATYNVNNSNIQGGYDGDGNFDEDPQFCNSNIGNYQLSENSSSITDSSFVGAYNEPGCETAYLNYALQFDGQSSYVDVDSNNVPTGNASRTISAWVNSNSFDGDQGLVSTGQFSENNMFALALLSSSSDKLSVWGYANDYTGDITLSVGEWYHIVAVYDSDLNNLKTYVNGEVDIDIEVSSGFNTSEGKIIIGARDGGDYFDGQIDEVSIFNYALSEDEILEYSGRALNGHEPGILSHYSFDEGIGNILIDVTDSGANGIIYGATWVSGAPVNAPEFPEPEIIAINVEVSGNSVTFDFEADTAGFGYYDFAWELNDHGRVMSYESVSAHDLRPGLHYVRAALVNQYGDISGNYILQSFYILDEYEQFYYTNFDDTVGTGLPEGWNSFSNGQGWYVTDSPYIEWWVPEPGVGNVIISNDDAADNDGQNDFNDGSQDYLNLPTMDFTSFGGPVALEFGSFFNGQWDQTAHVTYSSDGGNSWNLLADVDTSNNWVRQYFDLSFLQDYDNVVLGFHSNDNGGWGSGWIIDDVSIIEAYSLQTRNVSGYVYSSSNENTLSNALVIAIEENGSYDVQTTSNDSGFFSLDLLSGANYYLVVSRSNYQDNVQYISVGDSSIYLDIYLDDIEEVQDAFVEGFVTDWYTNDSLESASLLFAYEQGELQTIEVSTDVNGYFMVQVPGEKDYDLFIYADGYWVEHDAFYLSQYEHLVLNVGIAQMSAASRLYGTVRDSETNDLIPYAEVYLNCEEASDWDRTGNLGTYRVFNYYSGDCENGVLVTNADGYETKVESVSDIEFEAGSSLSKDIILSQGNDPEPGFLSGRVVSNIDGSELHGAFLTAFSINTGQIYEATTDSGYFEIMLPESEYSISINAGGHQEKFFGIYIESGAHVDTTIYLDQVYSNLIYGIVTDNNGQAINNVIINAQFEIDSVQIEQSAVSAEDGSYILTVPNGLYRLSASLTGYQVSWVNDILIEDSEIEVNFTLNQIESFDGGLIGSVYFFGNLSGSATIIVYNDIYYAETISGDNGAFYLDLINGTYSLFASSNGYSSIVVPDAITINNNTVNYDIYFTQPGYVEPPIITSLLDVPEDQGRYLDLTWLPGDAQNIGEFTQYSVWRKISNLPAGTPELWHYITTENYIDSLEIYERVVPTLIDANQDTIHYSTFMVTAHTNDPYVFFDSPPYSGFSVDNLSPDVPADLSISNSIVDNDTYQVDLSWSAPIADDFAYHNVYRSDLNNEEAAIVFRTIESSFEDMVSEWGNFEYWVTAVDHNGNESDASEAAGIELSVKEEILPEEFALNQNYPNPFNPSTQIRYALAENSNVTITIFNMLGNKVRTLVNERQDAGFRNVLWNATNDNGSLVAAGMYIYTIQAGKFYQARKMILLK